MSVRVTLRYSLDVEVGGHKRILAQPTAAPTIELENDPADYAVSIEPLGTAVMWSPTVSGAANLPPDFDLCLLRSDADVMLELTCNKGHASVRTFAVALKANIPLLLGDDASFYGVAVGADIFGGTEDVIDEIRAKNLSSDDTAIVSCFIGT